MRLLICNALRGRRQCKFFAPCRRRGDEEQRSVELPLSCRQLGRELLGLALCLAQCLALIVGTSLARLGRPAGFIARRPRHR